MFGWMGSHPIKAKEARAALLCPLPRGDLGVSGGVTIVLAVFQGQLIIQKWSSCKSKGPTVPAPQRKYGLINGLLIIKGSWW